MERDTAVPPFDIGDFARRWERARLSALRAALPGEERRDEAGLVEAAFAGGPAGERGEKALRAVFDNSRKLGAGLSASLGVTFEIQDLQDLVEAAAPPCLRGTWSARPRARVLERPGCGFAAAAGPAACDWWREALDGLVMGLGDRERLARHACARRGDGACVDVIFRDDAGADRPEAWAAVPDHMSIDLQEAAEYFRRRTGLEVELKGVNEGILQFRLANASGGACAPGTAASNLFGELVRQRFPGLGLRDITPRAVLTDAGPGP